MRISPKAERRRQADGFGVRGGCESGGRLPNTDCRAARNMDFIVIFYDRDQWGRCASDKP
jgi:hypothetical protein